MRRNHRVISLSKGVAMVVTDLHGDWDLYRRYRDHFLRLYAQGDAQYLILGGDLIHRESEIAEDGSMAMVLDVMKLQQKYPDAVILLCGNHEMVHIYHILLARGEHFYTPSFEADLGMHRSDVIAFFKRLPFFVRTKAGVSITHAGAASALSVDENVSRIFNFSHNDVIARTDRLLAAQDLPQLRRGYTNFAGEDYDTQVQKYLAVYRREDARYNDLLKGVYVTGDPDFELLWETLFTRCEKEYGERDYRIFLNALLVKLSKNFSPQSFLVSGHISVRRGEKVIARRQLRIASGIHAQPKSSAKYLLFDVGQPMGKMTRLRQNLRSIFEDTSR